MHPRSRFALFPAPQNFKQAITLGKIRHLSRNRIPRHIARAADRSEIGVDLVPVSAFRRFLGNTNAREPGRIDYDDAFVRDLHFDGPFRCDWLRQSYDGFGKSAGMIDVRSVGLRHELHYLVTGLHRSPVERRGDLQHRDLLRSLRVVPQSDLAAYSQPMLFRLDLHIEIVIGEAERLTVQREAIQRGGTEGTQKTEKPDGRLQGAGFHFDSAEPCFARLCLTISYRTTAAATETFSDGTLPSMGIETRKSHFLFTRSCSPLPSPPRTSAQSMLESSS